jgi:hypothetical protein
MVRRKKMQKVCDLFDVAYGVNLELNALSKSPDGVNFVSRTGKNNGVSARVREVPGISPIPAGTISVAGGGSVMASFLQTEPYYSGRDLYYLTPKSEMSVNVLLYYCACLRANKYRYSYGRQANRTLKDILIPSLDELPSWVHDFNPDVFVGSEKPLVAAAAPTLSTDSWGSFKLGELFDIRKGKRLTKANQTPGDTIFIGAIDGNNGVSGRVGQPAIHDGKTITVNYNGNGVADAFYQPEPFWASDDVNVLYPTFEMSPFVALFLCTIIRKEKFRFNYGRKWHLERMERSEIRLPVTDAGAPDWEFMEKYVKSMQFSSKVPSQ